MGIDRDRLPTALGRFLQLRHRCFVLRLRHRSYLLRPDARHPDLARVEEAMIRAREALLDASRTLLSPYQRSALELLLPDLELATLETFWDYVDP